MSFPFRPALRAAATALFAAILAACGDGTDRPRGHVDTVDQTGALTKASVDAAVASTPGLVQLIGGTAKCDVTQHGITYDTLAPGGGARASAGLLVPSGCPGPYPILVYHHGTTVEKAFTTTSPQNGEAQLMTMMFASQGYVVVMPDLHGYGSSTLGWHPYLNAENTAAVGVDALRAAKKVLADKAVPTSNRLFLAGYSQGGHSAMAMHRTIERDHAGEFTVTAAVPMSGPYALSQTFLESLTNPVSGATIFSPMILVGFQKAYGDVYARPEDVFQAPWVNGIESLIPGTLSRTQLILQGRLPLALTGPGGLLTDAFVSAYQANPDFPARRRAAQNDLLDWKPKAPVALCGGARDPVVPFRNTATATTYFATQGVQVTPIDVEQVPQFGPTIAVQVAAAPDLSTYHGTIVPPLCLSLAKNQFFDPRR